jgi:hypothetical protein
LGTVLGGHYLGLGALAEREMGAPGPRAALAGFCGHAILAKAEGLAAHAMAGAASLSVDALSL